jgi:uncharacterized protein YyaL (SSP411 family)
MWRADDQVLLRRFRDGEAAIEGYAEDYACLIFGLLELVQADGDPVWLDWALTLQSRQDALFWDPEQGGWFSTTGADPTVLLRLKEDYDGAEPAPSSVSVQNLLTIAHLVGSADALSKAERTLGRYGSRAGAAARVIPMMLAALAAWHAPHLQVVIVGDESAAGTLALRSEVASHYLPFGLLVPVQPGARQESLARHLPFIGGMICRGGQATAYVCRDFACREPVTTREDLAVQLSNA